MARNVSLSPDAVVTIEYPCKGATYCRDQYGVYAYDTYPESSVLAGQTRRRFLGCYDTYGQAKADWPMAEFHGHSLYREPSVSHLPED
jgi:hypothetical protein